MDILARIQKLKAERNAVILAHNYQQPEIQDMADFVGDSLDLSRRAAETKAEVIVFCGVHFMAETAKILAPQKTVLLPDLHAGCPMADMVTAEDLRKARAATPDLYVIAYVNTSAAVKALTDICCTSANAERVVRQAPADRPILFVPDRHLGDHAIKLSGREMTLWPGFCPTHARILPQHILDLKKTHPDAVVIVHPECKADVRALGDKILSTTGMVNFGRETSAQTIIVATEVGLLHRLRKENPTKTFLPALDRASCPNMKKTNLEKVLWSLESMRHEITLPEDVMDAARGSVERMIASH
jgi:quinolinate synthase